MAASQRPSIAGTTVIIESGHWLKADRDTKRDWARGHGVGIELVYLDVPIEERWRRLSQRNSAPDPASVPLTLDVRPPTTPSSRLPMMKNGSCMTLPSIPGTTSGSSRRWLRAATHERYCSAMDRHPGTGGARVFKASFDRDEQRTGGKSRHPFEVQRAWRETLWRSSPGHQCGGTIVRCALRR